MGLEMKCSARLFGHEDLSRNYILRIRAAYADENFFAGMSRRPENVLCYFCEGRRKPFVFSERKDLRTKAFLGRKMCMAI